MNWKSCGLLFVFFFTFFLAASVFGQNILVWKNDKNVSFSDPEGAGYVECDSAITKALADNGYSYTLVNELPNDLTDYDIIFITLGYAVPCG